MAVPCTAVAEQTEKIFIDSSKQKTVGKPVTISGVGLFTGKSAVLTIHPAPPNSGIVFQRTDLPNQPLLEAILEHVVSTPRCTILGKHHFTIHTVEHVLAALNAMGIDNALLSLTGPEVPIMDGSALSFVEAIVTAGISEQEKEKEVHFLRKAVSWSNGEVHLIAIPAEEFTISYTLHFPRSTLLQSQYFQVPVNAEVFSKDISSARTFCFYEEIAPFIKSGFIKGGGLDNAIIIKNDAVINPDGFRFSNEGARHKILDLIGDLSLIPKFIAHVIAIRSGHASNITFARDLYKQINREKS